ncbi:unnamed protein product [Effrenium voratum]|nr:unnamed protein product [Effrenium voratum]|mmetsp:Transcript_108211/g.258259  ORF Transcript_108211/g.258259 Transcript_108211/m.258259 type:complete len:427 (+) Transcript_108211:87-1367(+)
MGCALSSPVELVRVQRHGSAGFRCAVAEMQGWRIGHEDAHAVHCDASAATCFVFDGHGGDGAALYCAPALLEEIRKEDFAPLPPDERLEQAFTSVDEKLLGFFQENPEKDSGTTVVGALCAKNADSSYTVKLLNSGDSRAIVVRGPEEKEVLDATLPVRRPQHLEALGPGSGHGAKAPATKEAFANRCKFPLIMETVDHKPDFPTEKARIEAAGGTVSFEEPPRLDGSLAVSRGLGDFEYKGDGKRPPSEQKVSCIPDIYEVSSLSSGSLCILGCDGIWDVMTADEVAAYVRDWLLRDPLADLGDIAAEMLRTCLQRNSRDNMTCMILQFDDGSDWSNFPDEMKNYEKLSDCGEQDEDVKNHYATFLRRAEFPAQAQACDICQRWLGKMNQCTCKQIVYCSRHCQKKGWKAHQSVCSTTGGKKANA